MNETKTPSEDNLVYEVSLNSEDLGGLNPHLLVEKLSDQVLVKLPSIKVIAFYNTKGKGDALVNLKFFSTYSIPAYQINKLQEQISAIATTLRDELIDRIEDAQHSSV